MTMKVLLPAAVAAVALVAAPVSALPTAVIDDARGDHPVAAGDILSVDMTTRKATLVVTMTLTGAPSTSTPYAYRVHFRAGECRFQVIYYGHPFQGTLNSSIAGCDDGDNNTPYPNGVVRVSGATIAWSVPLSAALRRGTVLTAIAADTELGGVSSGTALGAAGDDAATEKTYRIGG